jgi:hypothetical protein
MKRLLLFLLLPVAVWGQIPTASVGIPQFVNCPTGQPCGALAAYCQSYTPPSTSSATAITSLPAVICPTTSSCGPSGTTSYHNSGSPQQFYLTGNLSSTGIGISFLTGNVDINLNGYTLTYGTVPNGSGASQIGEYGFLDCINSSLNAQSLDASYATNGYCISSTFAGSNITIENGSIVESTNASSYYDPLNCPGSGTGSGSSGACGHHHETIASHVINAQYMGGLIVRHLNITWSTVDANAVNADYSTNTNPDVVECNTFNDEVTQLNIRAFQMGNSVQHLEAANTPATMKIQYNTMLGTPQTAIYENEPGAVVQYNDIQPYYYQGPPYTSQLETYSNDYALWDCSNGGVAQYNYIHGQAGRGMTCINTGSGVDIGQAIFENNYVSLGEYSTNGEYGPNGSVNGGTWLGGCEIDGGRGFEGKQSYNGLLENNTLIVNEGTGSCGGGGIVFTNYVSGDVPSTAPNPWVVSGNKVQIVNTSGSNVGGSGPSACYVFDTAQGNIGSPGPFFQPFVNENCVSDGNFAHSVAFGQSDYFQWTNPTYKVGPNPFTTQCGEFDTGTANCGLLIYWNGEGTPPPSDELGYTWTNLTLQNSACPTLSACLKQFGTTFARSGTLYWSYTPTVKGAVSGNPVSGVTVAVTSDGIGSSYNPSCTTNGSGQCTISLRYQLSSSPSGSALTVTNGNPSVLSFTGGGCTTLTGHNVTISQAPFTETVTLGNC